MDSLISIRKLGDPALRTVAQRVEDPGNVAGLQQALYAALAGTSNALAVAAPQIGRLQRAFIYDMGEGGMFVVNPAIVESQGAQLGKEGCLSIPGVTFEVERFYKVVYTCIDSSGTVVDREVTGLEARMVQHEIDHLDGVLAIDRVDTKQRKRAMRLWRELNA